MNVLKNAKPTMTMPRWALPPPGSPSAKPRIDSAIAITAKPVSCSGIRPTRSTSTIAIANPITRKMSSTAVPFVDAMSSARNVVLAPLTTIAASSVGVKIPTP